MAPLDIAGEGNIPMKATPMKKFGIFAALTFALAGCQQGNIGLGDESISEKKNGSDYGSIKTNTSTPKTTSDGSGSTTSDDGGSSSAGGQTSSVTPEPGQITAGEWNDLSNWSFWNTLNQKSDFSQYASYWSYNLSSRIAVNLTYQAAPQVDATVELLNADGRVLWTSRTDNKGNAELWPSLGGTSQFSTSGLKVRVGNELFGDIKVFTAGGVNRLTLESAGEGSARAIDVAFMVDATGSMVDEMKYLQAELKDVLSAVRSQNGNVAINTGAVFYRDQGDEYVTKVSDFTSNNIQTINFVGAQQADNGGDTPEAVHTALGVAINNLKWSTTAKARILFIVLDAPPHYETSIVSQMHELVRTASAKGVKIIPVVASGADKETEFLLRYMAIATNGTYVFLTDKSGIGNTHLVPSIGEYQDEYLNALMVRLINDRIKSSGV